MNQELTNYITQARLNGKTDDQIRKELLSSGWAMQDIEALIGSVQEAQTYNRTSVKNTQSTNSTENSSEKNWLLYLKLSKTSLNTGEQVYDAKVYNSKTGDDIKVATLNLPWGNYFSDDLRYSQGKLFYYQNSGVIGDSSAIYSNEIKTAIEKTVYQSIYKVGSGAIEDYAVYQNKIYIVECSITLDESKREGVYVPSSRKCSIKSVSFDGTGLKTVADIATTFGSAPYIKINFGAYSDSNYIFVSGNTKIYTADPSVIKEEVFKLNVGGTASTATQDERSRIVKIYQSLSCEDSARSKGLLDLVTHEGIKYRTLPVGCYSANEINYIYSIPTFSPVSTPISSPMAEKDIITNLTETYPVSDAERRDRRRALELNQIAVLLERGKKEKSGFPYYPVSSTLLKLNDPASADTKFKIFPGHSDWTYVPINTPIREANNHWDAETLKKNWNADLFLDPNPDNFYGYKSDGDKYTLTTKMESPKSCGNTAKICLYAIDGPVEVIKEKVDDPANDCSWYFISNGFIEQQFVLIFKENMTREQAEDYLWQRGHEVSPYTDVGFRLHNHYDNTYEKSWHPDSVVFIVDGITDATYLRLRGDIQNMASWPVSRSVSLAPEFEANKEQYMAACAAKAQVKIQIDQNVQVDRPAIGF